jgi:glycosyltransferase involved in cell wall biosynthesis
MVSGGTETDISHRNTSSQQANLAFIDHVAYPVARDLTRIVDILEMNYPESVSSGVIGLYKARWMFSVKLVEYLGASAPIVSSNIPVFREMLLDGEKWFIIALSDIDSWSVAFDRIAENPELAAHIRSNARDQCARQHTWTRMSEKITEADYEL